MKTTLDDVLEFLDECSAPEFEKVCSKLAFLAEQVVQDSDGKDAAWTKASLHLGQAALHVGSRLSD